MFLNLRLSTLSLFHPTFEKNCVSDFCLINSLIQLLHVVDCSFSFCYQYRVIIIKRFQFFLQNTAYPVYQYSIMVNATYVVDVKSCMSVNTIYYLH